MERSYRKGDDVYVFYRMDKRCMPQRKYMAVLDPRHGAYRPRVGLSEGWLPARVVEDHDPAEKDGVRIEYRWPHFFTSRGYLVDSSQDWSEIYPKAFVMPAPELPGAGPCGIFSAPGVVPDVGIIAVRWGGRNEIHPCAQWGETGSSVSDVFLESFIDMAVAPNLACNYEVWTVYIEDHSDMLKLANGAHLFFGANHPIRRCKSVAAMYFLYPTAFEEGCVPSFETGEDDGAGLVDQKSFFQMMKAMERANVPSRFPHCSGLYEVLASKRWTYMLALTPQFRVPPTVALPRMLIERDVEEAATRALQALLDVKKKQAALRGGSTDIAEIQKGVAKLGFSWEALDVKCWKRKEGLQEALHALVHAIEISQELTGQPHDCESLIIQEYIEHDLELRQYVVDGKVEGTIYTKFCRIKDNNEFGDFEQSFDQAEAARQWVRDDVPALVEGERQCSEVTAHWMAWLQAQTCELPPAIRFDYFVKRTAPGQARVYTLEICELGFSMLGEPNLPSKVFNSLLRSCLASAPAKRVEQAATKAAPPARAAAARSGKAGGRKASGGKAASTWDECPEHIFIYSPVGTKAQIACTGKYKVIEKQGPQGYPLWKHSKEDLWLYKGVDGVWYVGDQEEYDMHFKCGQGYIRHAQPLESKLPHELVTSWERYDEAQQEWRAESKIVASDNEEVLKGKGKK